MENRNYCYIDMVKICMYPFTGIFISRKNYTVLNNNYHKFGKLIN